MISDCGELAPGQDDGVSSGDNTGDQIPDWPEDCEIDFSNVCPGSTAIHSRIFLFMSKFQTSVTYIQYD